VDIPGGEMELELIIEAADTAGKFPRGMEGFNPTGGNTGDLNRAGINNDNINNKS